jgi:hypothetical protein
VQAPVIAPAIALVAGALMAPAAPAATATTVIDRTLSCEAGITGGIRKLRIVAASAIEKGPQKHVAIIELTTQADPFRLTGLSEEFMDLSPKCVRSTASVPLTSRGLSGGAASIFEDEFGCPTPRRVLLHVRVVFAGRVALRLGSPIPGGPRMWYAIAPVNAGSFAVRTLGGKPIAYATVANTGKARVFTRGSCG